MTAPALYGYRATVNRWIDGDTVDLAVDVGFRITVTDRFRLYGIDTPERGQKNHDEATALANKLAPAGTVLTIATYKQDKYGRWLAELFPDNLDATVNVSMIEAGMAKAYFGGTKAIAD